MSSPSANSASAGHVLAVAPIRVLVVDDLAPLRAVLVRQLAHAGHAVVGEAATAAAAVTAAAALAPDVVLLDVHLPDGLGTAAAARIAAGDGVSGEGGSGEGAAWAPPAVVLYTGDPGRLSHAEVAAARAFALLHKPASPAALDRAVREAAAARTGRGHGVRSDGATPGAPAAGGYSDADPLVARLAELRMAAMRYAAGVARARARGAPRVTMVPRFSAFVRRGLADEGCRHPALERALRAAVVRWGLEGEDAACRTC